MGKSVAVFLWLFGAAQVLWALQSEIVFWRDLETTLYLAAGLCSILAGVLFYVVGDVEQTLRLLDRRLNPRQAPEPEGPIIDVTENKAVGSGKKK